MAEKAVTNVVGSVLEVPVSRLRRFDGQPRQFFDQVKLRELSDSIKQEGQKIPILAIKIEGDPTADYVINDGERRWLACQMAGLKTIKAVIQPDRGEEQMFIDSVVANFGREGHTPLEIAHSIKRILATQRYSSLPKGKQIDAAAALCTKSVGWVHQHLNLLVLHPQVQAMLEPGAPEGARIGFSTAVYLGSVRDLALQLKIAEAIASKKDIKLNEARALIRTMAAEAGMKVGGSETKPSKISRSMRRLLDRVTVGGDSILDASAKEMASALANCAPGDLIVMYERARVAARNFATMAEVIARHAPPGLLESEEEE